MKYSTRSSEVAIKTMISAIDDLVAANDSLGVLVALSRDFSTQMECKLLKKALEGRKGWDDPAWTQEQIKAAIIEHVNKGDMVDVANLAMFLWNRQQ